MQFADIFAEYYTLFRGDSDVPTTSDPEWIIAVRNCNGALRRLQETDAEDWDWLWTTAVADGDSYTWPVSLTTPSTQTFDCPTNMRAPGGWISLSDPVSGQSFKIDVIPAYNVQRQTGSNPYAFYTGDPQHGYTLHISLTGTSFQGYTIDFPYYKFITMLDASSDGNGGVKENGRTVTECPDSNYLIHSMLAARYRATRNYPSYQTAKADADAALQALQFKNRKGVDGHSFNLVDTSSGAFGV